MSLEQGAGSQSKTEQQILTTGSVRVTAKRQMQSEDKRQTTMRKSQTERGRTMWLSVCAFTIQVPYMCSSMTFFGAVTKMDGGMTSWQVG